jgi:hypothetical protein
MHHVPQGRDHVILPLHIHTAKPDAHIGRSWRKRQPCGPTGVQSGADNMDISFESSLHNKSLLD